MGGYNKYGGKGNNEIAAPGNPQGIIPGLGPYEALKVSSKEVRFESDFKKALMGINELKYADQSDAMNNTTISYNTFADTLKEGDAFVHKGSDYVWIVDKILKDGRIKAKRDRQVPNMAKKGSIKHEVASSHANPDDLIHKITGPGRFTLMAYNAIMQRKKLFGK